MALPLLVICATSCNILATLLVTCVFLQCKLNYRKQLFETFHKMLYPFDVSFFFLFFLLFFFFEVKVFFTRFSIYLVFLSCFVFFLLCCFAVVVAVVVVFFHYSASFSYC